MKDNITLRLDTETASEGKAGVWLIGGLVLFGACWILYELFTMSPPEPAAATAKGAGIGILILVIWGIRFLHSDTRLKSHLLANDIALYELTPKGITNHKGEFQRWDTLKKIYFRTGIVHFSYMTFNREAPFSMNSAGINNADFYEACEFIKTHAPKHATKKFKLEKIPRD